MAHEAFTDWKPRSATNKALLVKAVEVIGEYEGMGYQLTLRQSASTASSLGSWMLWNPRF